MWSLFSLLIVFLDKQIQYIKEIIEIEKKKKKDKRKEIILYRIVSIH